MTGLLAAFAFFNTPIVSEGKDVESYKLTSTVSPINAPEDLVRVPHTNWVIASSMAVGNSPGHIFAFKISGKPELRTLYPTNKTSTSISKFPPTSKYSQPDPKIFFPTGINLVRLKRGNFRLLVINHGGREAVELFELLIDAGNAPTLQWRDCVPLSKDVFANGIVPLDEDSFAITNSYNLSDKNFLKKI